MKKFVFAAVVIAMGMGIGTGSAFADGNSLATGSKSLGITASNDTMITGKLGLAQDLALLAGFGLTVKGGDDEGTVVQLAGGVRKYLKVTDFAPFAEGGLYIKFGSGGTSDETVIGLIANVGAEYFFNKQFSVEGSAGVSLSSNSSKTAGTTTSYTELSTQRLGVGLNFYF